jgi:hypothetical protein
VTRVNVVVEGPTEESFIKNVLAPSLWIHGVYVEPIVLGVPGHKGGNVNYARVKKDVLLQLKQDKTVYVSTMFDLYGLGHGFPGTDQALNIDGSRRAAQIENSVHQDIFAAVPDLRPDIRFLPYIQVHEYEGLLFSDTVAFAKALGREQLSRSFGAIREAFTTPEDINDNPNTAPSKRVQAIYPPYRKVIEGTIAAQTVGISAMRNECPRFANWVSRLEGLPSLN